MDSKTSAGWVLAVVVLASIVSALPAATQQPADTLERGRTVFFAQGCYGCHRLGVAGTPIAYDLSHIGSKYSEEQLAAWLRDPVKQKPTAHMPRLALTDDEVRALAAYLASLR
jgi:mono/diheme cytochrome c family protein